MSRVAALGTLTKLLPRFGSYQERWAVPGSHKQSISLYITFLDGWCNLQKFALLGDGDATRQVCGHTARRQSLLAGNLANPHPLELFVIAEEGEALGILFGRCPKRLLAN